MRGVQVVIEEDLHLGRGVVMIVKEIGEVHVMVETEEVETETANGIEIGAEVDSDLAVITVETLLGIEIVRILSQVLQIMNVSLLVNNLRTCSSQTCENNISQVKKLKRVDISVMWTYILEKLFSNVLGISHL